MRLQEFAPRPPHLKWLLDSDPSIRWQVMGDLTGEAAVIAAERSRVIKRRHQNGRWRLNLIHPEHIPLQMETDIGSASHWNSLRVLRVLGWYSTST